MGRSVAFNATLFFTSLFGLLASFANSFGSLCFLLFLLGSAVGVGLSYFLNDCTSAHGDSGFNANRWHSSTRAHAERKEIPGYRPISFLLIWFSTICSGRIACTPRTLLLSRFCIDMRCRNAEQRVEISPHIPGTYRAFTIYLS